MRGCQSCCVALQRQTPRQHAVLAPAVRPQRLTLYRLLVHLQLLDPSRYLGGGHPPGHGLLAAQRVGPVAAELTPPAAVLPVAVLPPTGGLGRRKPEQLGITFLLLL